MPGPFDQGWRRIVVAASGPSFTVEQADLIERARGDGICHVLAINATGRRPDPPKRPVGLPNADAIYGADTSFWNEYGDELKASARGQLWTRSKVAADKYGLRFIKAEKDREGLTKDPRAVNTGGNSGYAGINLAYLFGAVEIVLCGFDMKLGPNDEAHHHGDHDGRLANPTAASLATWLKRFAHLARDLERVAVRTTNCSLDSALQCFPRAGLGDMLERWRSEQRQAA